MTQLGRLELDESLPIGPGDVMWDWVGDVRSVLTMPGMLVLQTFHPTVAEGTGEHSIFETDPWGRQAMAIKSVMRRTYGGVDAITEGARLRTLHKPFTGVDRNGKRYGALNPDAYGWVHATAYPWLLTTAERFGRPLSEAEKLHAYDEHRRSGLMLGLREQDIPPTPGDFWAYYNDVLENRIEDHPTIHRLFNSLARPLPPPALPPSLHRAWPVPGRLVGRFGSLMIRGYLPTRARAIAGIPFTDKDQWAYDRICSLVRASVSRLPERRRYVSIARTARDGRPRPVVEH